MSESCQTALRVIARAGMACLWLSPFAMQDGHMVGGFALVGIGSALIGFAVEFAIEAGQ